MSETTQERPRDADAIAIQRMSAASRMQGLSATAARYLQQAARQLDAQQHEAALHALQSALALAPNHPEVLRVQGVLACRSGRAQIGLRLLQRALELWPDDALILGNIGSALSSFGDSEGAINAFRRASTLAPEQAAGWFNLGLALQNDAQHEEAGTALRRVLQLAPTHVQAHVAHASNLAALGRIDDAAAEYRHVISFAPTAARAWLGLVDLKTTRLDESELALLERIHASAAADTEQRSLTGFALGKALEDAARHDEAFAVFNQANAIKRRNAPWDARGFSRGVDAIIGAFAKLNAVADDRGGEAIFIVGLPRSGSTLIEQIISAHPEVEGAGELPDLEFVVREESLRRKAPLSAWAGVATADDWRRMGARYLERTARWRTQRPRHTDKMPDNWLLAGAALVMLPGARVIDCRRDPLETAWSCYKQWFGSGRQLASYDLADIAAQLRDHDRLMRFWQQRFPGSLREQSHEQLVADPEGEVRALLDFCGLAFDPACLRFNESARAVRSASAAQVRQPLHGDTARAHRHGALLAPLRRLLEEDASPASASMDVSPAASEDAAAIPRLDRGALLANRLAGLAPIHQVGLARAIEALAHQRIDTECAAIESACAAHPQHPEALHLMAALERERGHHAAAVTLVQRALAQRADDAALLDTLGRLQAEAGQLDRARQSFERALECDPHASDTRYKLAGLLLHTGDRAGARALLQQVVSDAPTFVAARTGLAELLEHDGDPLAAAQAYRRALHDDPASCAAWCGLVRVCAGALSATETDALVETADRADRAPDERARIGIALAQVLESRGRCREAFATLVAANALRRRALDWDENRFSAHCAHIASAFGTPVVQATDTRLGADIVFLVGTPDSALAEMETRLATHPRVAAGGESPVLAAVVADESRRRGRAFPDWAATADAADWQRLGEDYLQRARARHPAQDRLIDRTPALATLLGAAAAMLPGARFVECARAPLDACWALFRDDQPERAYACDLLELAAYWRAHAQLMALWRKRLGSRLHCHDPYAYAHEDEALRALLGAVALDFVPACTDGLARKRAVRAALDARETGLRHTFRASDYGDLLAPLQAAIDATAVPMRVPT